jgi:triacylglycerol esterase/lipase EstA (alpha/beta hydrolase family)
MLPSFRRLRRQLRYLAGYVQFAPDPGPARLADFGSAERPVLLLYGFLSTRRTFEVLERRLRRDGYCVFSLNLGGLKRTFNTRGIDDLADFVRAKVERIYGRNPGLGPLTIIGHSKGGLIGAYYVKKLGGWRRTRALITLGTPHNGTPAAYAGIPLGIFARSVWQMVPMSSFIQDLQQGAWPPHVRLASIYSRVDRACPYPSALLDPRGLPYITNVEVAGVSHREFLHKKRVYDLVVGQMRAAELAKPVEKAGLTLVPGSAPPGSAAASSGR